MMLRGLAILLAMGALQLPAAIVSFSDSFEGASIDPFWQVTEDYGTITTSTDVAYSGTQSAKFASTSGGQRGMVLTHDFGEAMLGTVSVRFYDYSPGQETLYEFLRLYTLNAFGDNYLGAADYDAFCYQAGVAGVGPNQSCGIYPGPSTTNIARTSGWHLFQIVVDETSIAFNLDGNQVYSALGDHSFQYVHLAVSGPYWRPNTIAYWDDVQIDVRSASTATPEPGTCFAVVSGLVAIYARRRKYGKSI